MKKFCSLIMLILISFLLAGCKEEYVDVNIYVDGEFAYYLTVEKGSKIDFNLETEDYVLINWTNEDGSIDYTNYVINEEMNIYANAVKKGTSFDINYYFTDDASFDNVGYPRFYRAGVVTELVNPVRPNRFVFTGWYYNGELISEIPANMVGDIDLYDSWEDHNSYYHVTYEKDDATWSSAELKETVIAGSDYYLPYVTKEGYFFNGWYTDREFKNRIYALGENNETDITLYAKFVEKTKANTYVSFVGDSISTYHGLIPPDAGAYYPTYVQFPPEHTYFLLTCNEMGFNFLKNDSYAGSRLTSVVNNNGNPLPEALSDYRISGLTDGIHDPDILILHIGTNDYSQGISAQRFRDCIVEYCKKVRKLYDDVEIYFCLHPCNGYGPNFVAIREAFNDAIIEESKPENSNYQYIDLRKAWNEDNWREHIFANAHPNEKGFRAMADVIIEELQKTHNYN